MTPKKPEPRITAWSFSRYTTYTECPRKARYKFIDKLPEPKHPAMQRGIDIHELAEKYVTGRLKKLPKELRLFTEEFNELRTAKHPVDVEAQLAFTDKWASTDWFARDAWLRVKMDVAYQRDDAVLCIDHKTGKHRPQRAEEYRAQLELYAVAGLLTYPDASRVESELWYLDEGHVEDHTFLRKDLKKLQRKWERNVKPMLNDQTFAPRPGDYCRWCFFSEAKGGPCEY